MEVVVMDLQLKIYFQCFSVVVVVVVVGDGGVADPKKEKILSTLSKHL
jgi:hypothetical protein